MCDYEIRLSLHNFLVYRTVFCRHTGVHSSCVLNALQGFGDSALYGVMLQLFVVFLKFLRSKVLVKQARGRRTYWCNCFRERTSAFHCSWDC